jgi:hypothetical protein
MKNRTVNLELGGTATFTQRGSDPNAGFIRVNGKTITGYVSSGNFYADVHGLNAPEVTPDYLLPASR